MQPRLLIKDLGICPFAHAARAMRAFTDARQAGAEDECWLLEHEPVFTLGQAGRAEHLLAPDAMQVVRTDRGGQVTWHGPGQLVAYLLLDLKRAGFTVRRLVSGIEASVIRYLATLGLAAGRKAGAPGVYVAGAKIAALGLRIRRGCSYHGLSLNIRNDLAPFAQINPCGMAGLPVTSLLAQGIPTGIPQAKAALAAHLAAEFGHRPIWQPSARAPAHQASPCANSQAVPAQSAARAEASRQAVPAQSAACAQASRQAVPTQPAACAEAQAAARAHPLWAPVPGG